MDLNGFPFSYTWHEMTDRGFLFAMPWKQRSMQLNEVNLNTRNLGEGMQVPVGGLNTEAQFTKPPDYLQVSNIVFSLVNSVNKLNKGERADCPDGPARDRDRRQHSPAHQERV